MGRITRLVARFAARIRVGPAARAIVDRLLFFPQERSIRGGKALQEIGKGLQELEKADRMRQERLAAAITMLTKAGVPDKKIARLAEEAAVQQIQAGRNMEVVAAFLSQGRIKAVEANNLLPPASR